MIRISRAPIPQDLRKAAALELEKVVEHYAGKSSTRSWEKYRAYKAPGVVVTLKKMFNKKCAYCESRMMVVQPIDVDHFRPKSAVRIGKTVIKPGYYWLAGSWSNLLPSCILCNRENRLLAAGESAERTSGKGMDFPLLDGSKPITQYSAKRHIKHERPLLLDPCGKIDPTKHLAFDADGQVNPRPRRDGCPSPYGHATIVTCGLQRDDLVGARREVALRILGEIGRIEEEFSSAENAARDVRIAYHLNALANYLTDDQPYLGMATQIIDARQPGLRRILPGMLSHFLGAKAPRLGRQFSRAQR